MDESAGVWLRDEADVSNAMVVVAAPTMGFVGPITAQFLVRQLDMELVGGLVPDSLPAVTRVGEGRNAFPVGVHTRETRCGPRGECDRLVVVETELLPDVPTQHELARTFVDWAQEHGAGWIVAPDGLFIQEEETEKVRGVASGQAGLEAFASEEIEAIEGGYIAGLSAALLCYSEMAGVDAMCLLAESNPSFPDARAAARIVNVLDRVIPEIAIETEPLIEEAEEIEENVRREIERLQAQSQERPSDTGMMFT